MSAGKFVGGAITEAVLRLNPFGKEGYERRAKNKAYRKARRKFRRGETLTPEEFQILNETQEVVMALDLGTRTSTNALVGGTILSQVYVQVVSMIPGEGALEALLLQPESIAFFAVLLAAVVARFSKTPAEPKAL